jgi:hypothetical protein
MFMNLADLPSRLLVERKMPRKQEVIGCRNIDGSAGRLNCRVYRQREIRSDGRNIRYTGRPAFFFLDTDGKEKDYSDRNYLCGSYICLA